MNAVTLCCYVALSCALTFSTRLGGGRHGHLGRNIYVAGVMAQHISWPADATAARNPHPLLLHRDVALCGADAQSWHAAAVRTILSLSTCFVHGIIRRTDAE